MRPRRKPLILLLVKRAVFFLMVMCALSFFLYGIGTSQDFLESTQFGLLRLSSVLGLLLAVGSGYGVVIDVFYTFASRSKIFIWGAVAYACSALLGAVVALLANGILVVVSGNIS